MSITAEATDLRLAVARSSGDQRHSWTVPDEPPQSADLSRGQPGDTPILLIALTSDMLPLTKVSDYANSILAQKLSQMPWRRPRERGRRAEPRDPSPGQSGAACRAGHGSRGRANRADQQHSQPADGVLHGGQRAFGLLTQLTTASGFDDFIIGLPEWRSSAAQWRRRKTRPSPAGSTRRARC
jgi:hypothetical protein